MALSNRTITYVDGDNNTNHTPVGTPDFALVVLWTLDGEVQPTGYTYGGSAMTEIAGQADGPGGRWIRAWYHESPAAGEQSVSPTNASWEPSQLCVITWSGAAATGLRDITILDSQGSATFGEVSVDSAEGDDIVGVFINTSAGTVTGGTGATVQGQSDLVDIGQASVATKAGAATSTSIGVSWSGSQEWAAIGFSVQPAGGGGGGSSPLLKILLSH